MLTRRHHEEQCNGEVLPNVKPSHEPLNREGSLSCRTCCDLGPQFTFEDCLSKKLLVDFRIVKDGILSYKQACYGCIWKIYINIKDISVSFFVDVMTTEASKVYTVLNKCWDVPRLTHCCSIEYCCKINYGCRELTDIFPHCTILTNQVLWTYLCQPSCIIIFDAIFGTIACFVERFISFIWLHWLASVSCVLRRGSCENIFFSRTNRLILTKCAM